jgi:hypothetical protein
MNEIMEKIAFALLPILVSAVAYLTTSLSDLNKDVALLNSKISLVVTSDNKQATNTGAELAREILRQDLEKQIQSNKDMILENRRDIAVLQDQMRRVDK